MSCLMLSCVIPIYALVSIDIFSTRKNYKIDYKYLNKELCFMYIYSISLTYP